MQHTSNELRAIANILDAMENLINDERHDLSLRGVVDVFWDGVKMGELRPTEELWDYYPCGKPYKSEGGVSDGH